MGKIDLQVASRAYDLKRLAFRMRNLEAVFTELNQLLAYANSRFFDIIDLASIQRGGDLKIRNDCDKLVADYTDKQTEKGLRDSKSIPNAWDTTKVRWR